MLYLSSIKFWNKKSPSGNCFGVGIGVVVSFIVVIGRAFWWCYRRNRQVFFDVNVDVADFEHDELFDYGKAKEKDIALYLALKQLTGDFGKDSMLSLSRFFRSRHAPVIPTCSLRLDSSLGIEGLPMGRMVEIYGKEASGKTTLALHIIREAQKLRVAGYCAYLDAENVMDPILADSIGVDIENLLLVCPDSAENMLSVVDT